MKKQSWWDRYVDMVENGCDFLDTNIQRETVILANFKILQFMIRHFQAYMDAAFFEAFDFISILVIRDSLRLSKLGTTFFLL